MKNYLFIVEKTHTGFSAYANDFEKFPVGTTGTSISELKANILEAANLYQEETGGKPLKESKISIRLDLAQFFEYYRAINAKGVAERIGMSQSLLAQYINGAKTPSGKQVTRILSGIKQLGKELQEIELV
ncbi:MAG: helix-turn-helix transcriptional regulator [Phormidesmis sp. FL-bin-119]|nr:helix-turn-helix transcriptional regulator [Pedobacter sp.]